MSLSNASANDSEKLIQASRVLSPEEKAALRARVERLMSPEDVARMMSELQDKAAKIVAIGESLLDTK